MSSPASPKAPDNSWRLPFLDFIEKLGGHLGKLAEKPEAAATVATASVLAGPVSGTLLMAGFLYLRFKLQWEKERGSSEKSARIQQALDDQVRAAKLMEGGHFDGIDHLVADEIDDASLPLLILCRDIRANGGKLDGLGSRLTAAEVSLRTIRTGLSNLEIRSSQELTAAFAALQKDLHIETSKLPGALRPSFEKLEQSLGGRLDQILENQGKQGDTLNRVATELDVHDGADRFQEKDLLAYARRLENEFEEPEILRVRPSLDGRRVSLSKLFVEPRVRLLVRPDPSALEMPSEEFFALQRELDGTPEDQLAEKHRLANESYQVHQPLAARDAIAAWKSGGILLFAGAGGGKSALLRVLALRWARAYQEEATRADVWPVPILVELRRYATARAADHKLTLLEFIAKSQDCLARLPQAAVDAALKNGTARLFLDGLDEVPKGEPRRKLLAEIHALLDDGYPCLVTSRVFGFEPAKWCDRTDVLGFHMLTLDKKQQDFFIQTAARSMESGEEAAGRIVARVKERLAALPHAEEMAANPLLLTLILLVHATQAGVETRADLYEQASALLIDAWEVQRLDHDRPNPPQGIEILQKKTKLRILHHLAWQRLTHPTEEGENLFTHADIEKAIDAGGTNLPEQTRNHHKENFPTELRGRNYVLCSRGGEKYSFVHRTFLEYFAALHLAWLAETHKLDAAAIYEQFIRPHLHDQRWRETLRLYLSLAAESDIPGLHALLLAGPEEAEAPHSLLLSAQAILDTRQEARPVSLVRDIAAAAAKHLNRPEVAKTMIYCEMWDPSEWNDLLARNLVGLDLLLDQPFDRWRDPTFGRWGGGGAVIGAIQTLSKVYGLHPAFRDFLVGIFQDSRNENYCLETACRYLCDHAGSWDGLYGLLRGKAMNDDEPVMSRSLSIFFLSLHFWPDLELKWKIEGLTLSQEYSTLVNKNCRRALRLWKEYADYWDESAEEWKKSGRKDSRHMPCF